MNILIKTALVTALAVAGVCSVAAGAGVTTAQTDCTSSICPSYDSARIASGEYACSSSNENGIFDLLSPELVRVYEENVSKEPVVSDLSPARLARMAQKYGCGEKKMCALIVVRDMAARAGGSVTLAELSKESDLALIKRAKQYVDVYAATLSDEEKKDLEDKFKAALKGNPALSFIK